eukprot:g3417.t1
MNIYDKFTFTISLRFTVYGLRKFTISLRKHQMPSNSKKEEEKKEDDVLSVEQGKEKKKKTRGKKKKKKKKKKKRKKKTKGSTSESEDHPAASTSVERSRTDSSESSVSDIDTNTSITNSKNGDVSTTPRRDLCGEKEDGADGEDSTEEDDLMPLIYDENMHRSSSSLNEVRERTLPPVGKWRDIFFAGLFVGHFVVLVLLGFVCGLSRSSLQYLNADLAGGLYLTFFVCVCVGFVTSALWLALHLAHAARKELLILTQWFPPMCLILTGICVVVINGEVLIFLGLLAVGFVDLMWAFANRARASDRACVIARAVGGRALVVAGMFALAATSVFLFGWSLILVECLRSGSSNLTIVYVFFSGYWTAQVIENALFVSVSGTLLFKILSSKNDDCVLPADAVLLSMLDFTRRAFTNSFGSVCRAALLVAPTHVLWNFCRVLSQVCRTCSSLSTGGGSRPSSLFTRVIGAVSSSASGVLLHLVRRNHRAALAHVAFYGKSFSVAAKDTWELLYRRSSFRNDDDCVGDNDDVVSANDAAVGIDVFRNGGEPEWQLFENHFNAHIPLFGPNMIGCLLAGIMTLILSLSSNSGDLKCWNVLVLSAFYMGHTLTATVLKSVRAAVSTVHISFAEQPEMLQRSVPLIYHRLKRIRDMQRYRAYATSYSLRRRQHNGGLAEGGAGIAV